MFKLRSPLQSMLLLMTCISAILLLSACEPIVDFSSTADAGGNNTEDGILRPSQAMVRPKNAVDVPADPLLQIRLLTNDSSKGWQLKKRQRKGVDTVQPCNQDDGLVIYASKRIDFEIGAIRCGIDDSKQTGTWQLTDRPIILVSSGGENPYEAQLLELSTNRMVISYVDEENEPVLESYETPVEQEPIEEGPIVLTPTPAPTPRTTATPTAEGSASEAAASVPDAEPTASTAPGSGAFKTGL